jgi:hypothetical protein
MSKMISEEVIKNDLLTSISSKFNIPYADLIEELNCLNKIKTVNSKYSCDHYFFSRDNEESFYWAGFIAADGCAYGKKTSKTLTLTLAEKDSLHLLCFKNNINYDGPIYKSITKHSQKNPKWNDSTKESLCISSSQIFQDLKRFNITPNKTKIYTFPEWLVNHSLIHHFMRGYVDGDGSFFEDKSRGRICFELRGTKEFLDIYKNILESKLDMQSRTTVTTPDSTSKIKYYSKHLVPQIVDFLYQDATIYLSRKHKIAMKSKEVKTSKKI